MRSPELLTSFLALLASSSLPLLAKSRSATAQGAEATSKSTPSPAPSRTTALDEILKEVQIGLAEAQDMLATSGLPPLEHVVLTLHTETAKDATGQIKIFVISVGGGPSVSASQELVLSLMPPKAGIVREAFTESRVSDAIVAMIKMAAESIRNAETGKPPLEPDNVSLEFAFTVTKTAKGGLSFQLAVVGIDLGGGIKNQEIQKAKITFSLPKK